MSGYTDLPYRRSMRRHGCAFAFTEMIDAGSLVFGNRKTMRFLDRGPEENWLGAQIVGSDPETLAKAAEIISGYPFDILDFNLGCPAPKVVKKGEGSALARDLEKALRAFEALKRNCKGSLSAKIRILHESDPEPTLRLARGLEEAGASAICVHGRIAKQFYSGPVNLGIIGEMRKNLKIQIVANGGINSLEKYRETVNTLGGGPAMLASGAMGNPWLFDEIASGGNWLPPDANELAGEMERHILETCGYHGDDVGLRISRKFIFDYMRGRGYPSSLRNSVIKIKTRPDFDRFIREIRKGPSEGYFKWLDKNPNAPRRMRGSHACIPKTA